MDENLGDARSGRRPGGERTNARRPALDGQFMGADARHFRESTDDQPRHLALELSEIHAGGTVRKGQDGRRSNTVLIILEHVTRRKNIDEERIKQGWSLRNLGYP